MQALAVLAECSISLKRAVPERPHIQDNRLTQRTVQHCRPGCLWLHAVSPRVRVSYGDDSRYRRIQLLRGIQVAVTFPPELARGQAVRILRRNRGWREILTQRDDSTCAGFHYQKDNDRQQNSCQPDYSLFHPGSLHHTRPAESDRGWLSGALPG